MKVTIDLSQLLDFLANVLGENTEVALHQLDDINTSLIAIRNGHITGREVGMPLTELALTMIKEFEKKPDRFYKINYLSMTKTGQKLRSSSMLICDEYKKPKAMLCVNHDDSEICNMITRLKKLITIEDKAVRENFSTNVQDMHEKIIDDVIARSPIPVARLSVEDKIDLVAQLSEKGVFLIKGSIETVAKALSISEPTLYRYLKQING